MADYNKDNGGKRTFAAQSPNQSMLRRTLFLLIVCGVAAFGVLIARLAYLQIYQHDYYESLAVEQQVRQTNLAASRGTIFDRNMKILAMSASVDTVFISPAEIKMYGESPQLIASELSRILGVDYDKILEMTDKTNSWYVTVARKVEKELADEVRRFKSENKLQGVKLESDTKRYYPYSSLASHVVGFVGIDNQGLGGIESRYEEELQGVAGRVVRAKTAQGVDMLFTRFEDYYDAEDGNDLVLTIDSTIQYYLEKALETAIADYEVKNGAAAIAMDVKTGALLGLASLGNFDLNNYQIVSDMVMDQAGREAEPDASEDEILSSARILQWRNKALSDTYEPGSTFKIITLAMALEEGFTNLNDSFYCGGSISVLGRQADDPVKCWNRNGHGTQTLQQAVQHSCNVAFVTLGLRTGAAKFYEYARSFGFFERTGIDLAGEANGIWWRDDVFMDSKNLSQLAAASFGQTFNITPLQLITAVSACVNGGYLMEPHVVAQVRDPRGNIVSSKEPTVRRQVISEKTSAEICAILESVVGDKVEGTGKNAYVAGYRIGGKTGTSEKISKLAESGTDEYIVSFIGVAPADDPAIAILVMLDNPATKTIYVSGGQMAAPTVGKIFADVLPYMGYEPEYNDDERVMLDKRVPNLEGKSTAEAESMLTADGLTMRIVGSGETVTAQSPHTNAVVAAQSEIVVYTDGEAQRGEATMPDLSGMSYSLARQTLALEGLFMRTSSGTVLDSQTMVISMQGVTAGTQVQKGTVIEVSLADMQNLGRY